VQALAKGLAIIASEVGGFVDLVDEAKNGYLIKQENPAQFSDKLREVLEDSDHLLSLRNASLEKAKSFEIARIVDQYEKLFLGITRKESDLVETKLEI
jgi:glycosyltransferase involved in cell wall biosynthesis